MLGFNPRKKRKGQLLYLSKRIKHKDVSLFIHTNDPSVLGDFIAERLNHIENTTLPEGLKMAYVAYTFHLFGDSIQFSILADSEEALNKYLAEVVNKLAGVMKTTVNEIERTRPLVSYDEWKKYSSSHGIVPFWDEELMINQFQD